MTIATNAWTNPRTGETRHYINFEEWAPAAGITKENGTYIFPKAQFVPSKKISRANLQPLKGFKVWADENGKITVDNFINFYNWGVDSVEEFAQKLEEAFAALGGLDFLATQAVQAQETVETKEVEPTEAAEEAAEFTGTLTTADIETIETAANGPMEEYDTPAEMAGEAAQEIAQKYGVDRMEIYNAYLKAKGQRPRQVFRVAWKHFAAQFEA